MSFGTYARRVRDRNLPYGARYSALRCAVERYMPLGFNATWAYITGRAGNVRTDEAALICALDVLEVSRKARQAELAEFACRRGADKKQRHSRTVMEEEIRYRYGCHWPGPDAHEATLRTVTALWDEHTRLPFPDVPPAPKGGLVELDTSIAGVIWTYLQRKGNLHPDHRRLLRDCLADLRGLRLSFPVSSGFFRLRKMAELIAHDALPLIRLSWAGDAAHIAEVFLAARAQMTGLPHLRSDEQTRAWVSDVMLPASVVWIAELHGRVAGFAALRDDLLEHLYVTPDAQGSGIGTALLDETKKARPGGLGLCVFQQNTGARRFYERRRFTLMEEGDGSDNEENLPDARYRWRGIDEPRQVEPSELNESLTCAFPDVLAHDVTAVVNALPTARHTPSASFRAIVGDDSLTIPARIYNPEPAPEALGGLSPLRRTILHCIYTRHHDGYVRRRHLRQIIGSLEPWVLPYIVYLIGEYVVEIVTDIQTSLGDLNIADSPAHRAFGRFLADNPGLLALIDQRVASYWSCYHRWDFPRLADYPGRLLVTAMRAAATSAGSAPVPGSTRLRRPQPPRAAATIPQTPPS
ncbi:N-acetyltransferase family protein [Microtetraspora malaysiensis]|uniref:GNAT family N-acetyltransferase n=1 Tax=Microtetraspora malaysiensis TaxID=161358 RepID=UPI003D8A31FF